MKTVLLTSASLGIALACFPTTGRAQSSTASAAAASSAASVGSHANCDQVAESVRNAIQKNPAKLLSIVEDFMITNESCACEIVKAAVLASHANAELRRQIAITATDIAPQQKQIIDDCLAALDKNADVTVTVQSNVQPVTTGDSDDSDYTLPLDLRGVFFIEPLNGGLFTPATTNTTTTTHHHSGDHGSPPNQPTPLSPSTGAP